MIKNVLLTIFVLFLVVKVTESNAVNYDFVEISITEIETTFGIDIIGSPISIRDDGTIQEIRQSQETHVPFRREWCRGRRGVD